MDHKYVNQLKNLLRDEQMFAISGDLQHALTEVKIEVHNRFWQMLDGDNGRLVAACRERFPKTKLLGEFGHRKGYNEGIVRQFHAEKGGRYFGLSIGLVDLGTAWLALRIECEDEIFYGFTILEATRPHANEDSRYRILRDVARNILPRKCDPGAWLACRTPEPVLNFRKFDLNCSALVDESKLEDRVDKLIADIGRDVSDLEEQMPR